jgi:hypothetical protein
MVSLPAQVLLLVVGHLRQYISQKALKNPDMIVLLLSKAARSEWNHAQYPKYITGTDRRTVRAHTVLRLDTSFNTRYAVKYLFFARILALCRPVNLTNPIRQLYTSVYSAYSCLIGLVVLIGRLSAMNLAKSLIVLEKNYLNHRTPMQ